MLHGEQVRLRSIEREDIPTFVRWFNDAEVRQYLLMPEPLSKAKEERWFEAQLGKTNNYFFAIEAQIDEQWVHIGNIELDQIDWKNRVAILRIGIGEKAHWGRGFGTDATCTILHFAFEELNLHRVECEVFDFNPRAIRCYEKLGFQHEGTRRQAFFRRGSYHNIHLMAILSQEFKTQPTS